jgi:hypothetical protein
VPGPVSWPGACYVVGLLRDHDWMRPPMCVLIDERLHPRDIVATPFPDQRSGYLDTVTGQFIPGCHLGANDRTYS